MINKRIAAGVFSFILLMSHSMTAFATQSGQVISYSASQNTIEETQTEETSTETSTEISTETSTEKVSVSANSLISVKTSSLPPEYTEAVAEASQALDACLLEKDIYAIVYLKDSYEVKKEADASSDTVISVPMARTVQIMGMDVAWEYNNEAEDYIPNVWYETQFYEGETLYHGYIEESYLAYSDEVLLQWKSDWASFFPLTGLMSAAGGTSYTDVEQFPSGYQSNLRKLKDAHPNWIFIPMRVNRNWADCVKEQMGNYSWIYYNQPGEYRGSQINSTWYYASEKGIAYYMDPRNFLTENSIFQFEQNTYNASYHTQEALQAFLNNTFMKGTVPGDASNRTYAKVIFDSGKSRGLSPFNLAARVVQEQGVNGTSPMISGTYPGYEGYYNYYNISASGTTNEAVYKSGLSYAKTKGWNTRVKALEGGAAFIGNGYILKGQDTLYLQKFDVEHGSDSLHQYMQNIMAPYTEGQSMKKMYSNAGSLNSAFVFKIPVYNNMPTEHDFSINAKSVTLQRGVSGKDTYTLQIKDKGIVVTTGVSYASEDPSVADVDASGKITAKKSGNTTITATVSYKDNDKTQTQVFTCAVKVLSPLQGITLGPEGKNEDTEQLELFMADESLDKVAYLDENGKTQYKYNNKGEIPSEVTLEVSYDPADTTDNKKVTWTVKDESILSLTQKGEQNEKVLITAKKSGSTTVTAKVGTFTKTVNVTVRIPMTEASLDLDSNKLTLHKGESTQVTVSYLPKNTSDRIEPIWRSEDESVAVVENGMIFAKKAGTTTLHAAVGAFDGSQSELTCQVTVKEYMVTFVGADGKTLMTLPGEYGKSLTNLEAGGKEIPWTLTGDADSYFMGWYTETDGKGTAVNENTILYDDMTLYPYFKETTDADFYVKPVGSMTYTGYAIKPEVYVYHEDVLLKKGTDYTLTYQNNKLVNDGADLDKIPTVIITGKGKYEGYTTQATFTIMPKNLSHVDIKAENVSVEYTGSVQKVRPTVLDGTRALVSNVDYTLEYTDTAAGAYKDAGTYKVKITGKGNYSGTRYVYITISRRILMEEVSISVPSSVRFNNGHDYTSEKDIEACKPAVTVKYGGASLIENVDYTLSYSDNTQVGTGKVTVKGMGSYIGNRTVFFTITGTDMTGVSASGILDQEYTGSGITQKNITLTDKSKNTLREGLDYTVSYKNNVETGKASVIFTGKNAYTGTLTKTFTIRAYNIFQNEQIYEPENAGRQSALQTALVSDTVEYDKAGAGPQVQVMFKGELLKEGTDYKISYRNNTVVTEDNTSQKPVVVITGTGRFTGEITKEYTITKKSLKKVSMTADNVTFKNKKGYCFAEPVLKDESGRRLDENKDYEIVSYQYVEDTLLNDGSTKLKDSVVAEDDIPVADEETEPKIRVTVKGISNYTDEITCTYLIRQDKGLFEEIFKGENAGGTISAGANENVEQTPQEKLPAIEKAPTPSQDATQNPDSQEAEDAKNATGTQSSSRTSAGQNSVKSDGKKDTVIANDFAKNETKADGGTDKPVANGVAEETTVVDDTNSNGDITDAPGVGTDENFTDLTMEQTASSDVDVIQIAAVLGTVAAASAVCAGTVAGGVHFYRKKKKESFFFDEEDEIE